MAQTSYPYADDAVPEPEWLRMARLFRESGVIEGVDGQLQVSAVAGAMQVEVAAGQAWLDGFYYRSSAVETLNLATADNTDPRIDRVVVRSDRTAREATLQVLTGTPAAAPTPPPITQDHDGADVYDLLLATLTVGASATDVDGGVADDRRYSQVAGGVSFVTAAERDQLATYPGRVVFVTDQDRLEVWNEQAGRWDVGGLRSVLPVADQVERDALATWDGRVVFRKDADYFEVWDATSASWRTAVPEAHTHAGYLPTTGGTMTGALTMDGQAVLGAAAGHGSALSVSGATTIDLNADYLTHELAGDVDYSTTNRAAGRTTTVRLLPGAADRQLAVRSDWTFVGTDPPTTLTAGTVYILTLVAFGTAEADVVAAIAEGV